jgi:hypothetical protein
MPPRRGPWNWTAKRANARPAPGIASSGGKQPQPPPMWTPDHRCPSRWQTTEGCALPFSGQCPRNRAAAVRPCVCCSGPRLSRDPPRISFRAPTKKKQILPRRADDSCPVVSFVSPRTLPRRERIMFMKYIFFALKMHANRSFQFFSSGATCLTMSKRRICRFRRKPYRARGFPMKSDGNDTLRSRSSTHAPFLSGLVSRQAQAGQHGPAA